MNSPSEHTQASKKTVFLLNLLQRLRVFPHFFDRIRWKLTFSYTLVTVVVILALILLAGGGAIWFASQFYFANIPAKMAEQAEMIAPYFSDEGSSQENLSNWLAEQKRFTIESQLDGELLELDLFLNKTTRLHIVDTQQRLLSSTDPSLTDATQLELNQTEKVLLEHVLTAKRGNNLAISRILPLRVFTPTAIVLDDQVMGSIVLTQDYQWFGEGFSFLVFSLLVITILAMLIGTIFGFIHSGELTRRLKRVEHATSAWRQGDFSSRVNDSSQDELGRLSTRLNSMAEDLAKYVSTRQELATLGERNRLALELHDSVKQQVFAIGMKLGFAESLANDDALKKTLGEVGELAYQTQDELQRLIHELKPLALEQEGLNAALESYVKSWANLHSIEVCCLIEFNECLPSASEQALFRVAQEGLANIARHARAERIIVRLCKLDNDVVLSIEDDGCGFNPEDKSSGLGRRSMLERMSELGGRFYVSSKAGVGTKIKARLPLKRKLT